MIGYRYEEEIPMKIASMQKIAGVLQVLICAALVWWLGGNSRKRR